MCFLVIALFDFLYFAASDSSESESPSKSLVKGISSQDDESSMVSAADDISDGSSDDLEDFNPFASVDGEGMIGLPFIL